MAFIVGFLQFLLVLATYSEINAQCSKTRTGVTDADIREILKTHNSLRQKVANGQQANQPSASNMNELTWNSNLANAAQNLADSCKFEHDHPKVVGFNYVGQNLYMTSAWGFGSDNNSPAWPTAVQGWYDEVAKFNKNGVSKFQSDSATGHYTQVVWATTKQVGCGFAFFKNGSGYSKMYVCNYGEGGNFIGQPMYLQGKACSKCNKCSATYPGLCSP